MEVSEHLTVDPSVKSRLEMHYDITFHALHCGLVNLDAMDVAGEQQNGVTHDTVKTRLSPEGKPLDKVRPRPTPTQLFSVA